MAIPGDPLLAAQWHLRAANLYTNAPGNPSVWDDYTGRGVTIGVYDNGVQATHPELVGRYNAALHYTGPGAVANNAAAAVGDHGTAVAGVIAAAANGQDGVGVAHGARITGVTAWTASNVHQTNAFFAGVMAHQAAFDVVNHSWGERAFSRQPSEAQFGIITNGIQGAAQSGRDGLGTIMVAAASNVRQAGQGFDGVVGDANVVGPVVGDRHVITVAGVGQNNLVADYSTPGSNLLVSAPTRALWTGAPAGTGIITTDKVDDTVPGFQIGADGFEVGNVANNLRGTSFSAPIVTGIVALMLEANPDLGWRDVKEILASTAVRIGTHPDSPAPERSSTTGSRTARATGTAAATSSRRTTASGSSTLARRCGSPSPGPGSRPPPTRSVPVLSGERVTRTPSPTTTPPASSTPSITRPPRGWRPRS